MALCPTCGKKSAYKGQQKVSKKIGDERVELGRAALFDCPIHGSFINPRDRAYFDRLLAQLKRKNNQGRK